MKKIIIVVLLILVGGVATSRINADEVQEPKTPEPRIDLGTLYSESYPSERTHIVMPKQPVADGVYQGEIFSYNVSLKYKGNILPSFVLSMRPGIEYVGYNVLRFTDSQGNPKDKSVIEAYRTGGNIAFLFGQISTNDIVEIDVHFTAVGEVSTSVDGVFGCWQGKTIDWKKQLASPTTMEIENVGWQDITGEYTGPLPADLKIYNDASSIAPYWFGYNYPIKPTTIVEKKKSIIPPNPPVDPSNPDKSKIPESTKPSVRPNKTNQPVFSPSKATNITSIPTADTSNVDSMILLMMISISVMLLRKKISGETSSN